MIDPAMKNSLAVGLGHLVASSPLEALIMPGNSASNGTNCIPAHSMAMFFPVSSAPQLYKPLQTMVVRMVHRQANR